MEIESSKVSFRPSRFILALMYDDERRLEISSFNKQVDKAVCAFCGRPATFDCCIDMEDRFKSKYGEEEPRDE